MGKRRADRLDPDSRAARLKSGKRRCEIQLSLASASLLDAFAQMNGLTRSGAVARMIEMAFDEHTSNYLRELTPKNG